MVILALWSALMLSAPADTAAVVSQATTESAAPVSLSTRRRAVPPPPPPEIKPHPGQIFALSDGRSLKSEQAYSNELADQKAQLCVSPGLSSEPASLDQATKTIRSTIEAGVGRTPYDMFLANPLANDATRLARVGVASLLPDGQRQPNPAGGVVALLRAHELEPDNPNHLINAAGTVAMLGMPREALALLDAADVLTRQPDDVMGISGAAVALNNRGHVLLTLGRWADAETVLREAIANEPLLSEAKQNLSVALLCQNKQDEAAHYLFGGMRRSIQWDSDDIVTDPPDTPAEKRRTRQPASKQYDLSQGKTLTIPTIRYPENPSQYSSMAALYGQYIQRSSARVTSNAQRLGALVPKQPHENDLTSERKQNLWAAMNTARYETTLAQLYESMDARWVETGDVQADVEARVNKILEPGFDEVTKAQCRAAIEAAHPQWMSAQKRYDQATAAYLAPWYKHVTGIAANLGDPVRNEIAQLTLENDAEAMLLNVVLRAQLYTSMLGFTYEMCEAAPAPAQESTDPKLEKSARCPEGLRGAKVKYRFGDLFEIGFNCEEVEVSLAAEELLGPFIKINLKNDGTITGFAGVQGGAGTVAQEGFYVTGNLKSGALTDGGFKVAVEYNAGPISVDGFEYKLSVATAIDVLQNGP
jgi:predicted Zn-dependent protease